MTKGKGKRNSRGKGEGKGVLEAQLVINILQLLSVAAFVRMGSSLNAGVKRCAYAMCASTNLSAAFTVN